mmetsp:Transcript_86866/g.172437  ORF Transcript_86866/g.172437 Transcript_86866/m.172437 type:complete len:149 (+) Transcript_86866:83-529(+)
MYATGAYLEHPVECPKYTQSLAELARELNGEDVPPSGQPDVVTWYDLGMKETQQFDMSEDDKQTCVSEDTTASSSARSSKNYEHFQLGASDAICQEADGVSVVNLLPVTSGSSRTAKRRFRRQRCRQKLRLMAQFPQVMTRELQEQDW